MSVRGVVGLALLVSTVGCGPGQPPPPPSDLRIDGAEDLGVDASDARMCVRRNGDIFVAWLDARADPNRERPGLWLTRSLDRGASWMPPVRVDAPDPSAESTVEAPDLACNSDGVYLVWEDDRDGVLRRHQIYFSRSVDDGATFEPDLLVEDDVLAETQSKEPKIVAEGSDLYVTWYDDRNDSYDIFVNASENGGESWRDPVRVDSDVPGSAYSAQPLIAATDGGQVFVTWEDARDDQNDIYFSRSDNGAASFKEDLRLDVAPDNPPGSSHSFEPQLSVVDQDVYVVWNDEHNGGDDIFMNYSSNGGALWLPEAVRLDTDQPGFHNSISPTVVSDRSTAHVVWSDQRLEDGGYDVFYRKIERGEPVGPEARLDVGDPDGFANSLRATVALGDGGRIAVGWEDGRAEAASGVDNNYNDLYYTYSEDEGATWASEDFRIDVLCPGQSFKRDLSLAIVGDELLAVWIDGRTGDAGVYFHTYPLGAQAELETDDGLAVDCSGS